MKMEQLKVTLCTRIPTNAYMGGIAVILNKYLEKKDYFSEENVDISLFSWHDQKVESIRNSKIRNILYWASLWRASIKYCKYSNPDIFHIHTAREFLFMRDVMIGSSIAKKLKIKCALTIHVGAIETVFHRIPKVFRGYLIGLLNKYFSKVFFLSKEIMEEFISVGLNRNLCKVLYNFHDMPEYEISGLQDHEETNLLFVGAIQREKGILELLRAVEKIRNEEYVHLDVCGLINDSTVTKTFTQFCDTYPDLINAHGYVKGIEKSELFHKADVLILPSYHEGLPLVILEALASGCAIIATKVGAIPEILSDENAIWVEVGDSESLYQAIKEIASNRNYLHEMKKKNLLLSKEFTLGEHIKKLCDEYHAIENG